MTKGNKILAAFVVVLVLAWWWTRQTGTPTIPVVGGSGPQPTPDTTPVVLAGEAGNAVPPPSGIDTTPPLGASSMPPIQTPTPLLSDTGAPTITDFVSYGFPSHDGGMV